MVLSRCMTSPNETEVLSFKTPKSQKRLAKILAAKMNVADVSALMNLLLVREINKHFSPATQRDLLSGVIDDDDGESAIKSVGKRTGGTSSVQEPVPRKTGRRD